MMLFLAIYSTTRFWTRCTFSEDSSNNSEKKSEKFFQDSLLPIIQNSQKLRRYALYTTLHSFFPNEGRNTFFNFFIKAESKYAHFFGFYSNSNGE